MSHAQPSVYNALPGQPTGAGYNGAKREIMFNGDEGAAEQGAANLQGLPTTYERQHDNESRFDIAEHKRDCFWVFIGL
jgi:hypothetical protein